MRLLQRVLGPAAVWVGAGCLAAACGSDSTCDDTRSCAGPKSEGGAGDAGSDAPTACEKNEDCENGLRCDGEATCVEHVCAPGTAVGCDNPDTVHCSATCVEPSGECEITANDLDFDEHLDPLCTDATVTSTLPVDDCDDALATVYPGADELCDGLDNDCDDKIDLDDGLELGGTTGDFVVSTAIARYPSIAGSAASQNYGVVWQDGRFSGGDEILFALMDGKGAKLGTDLRVSNAAGASTRPRIAWGNDSYGIVWADARDADLNLYFARLDQAGKVATTETPLTFGDGVANDIPDIISISDGWIVVFQELPQTVYGIRLALDGAVVTPKTILGVQSAKNQVPRLAALGNDFGLAWEALDGEYQIEFLRSDFGFNTSGQKAVSPLSAGMGDIAAETAGGNYRVLFSESSGLGYSEVDAAGAIVCGPVGIGGSGSIAPGGLVALAERSAFLAGTSSGEILFGIVPAGCGSAKLVPIDTVTSPSLTPHIGSVASGEAGVALVWEDAVNKKIRRRAMGPHLCD